MERFFVINIIKNFGEFFQNLDANRRIGLVLVFCAIVTAMIMLISWASKTQYKLLYTELNNEDSLTISRLLEESKISYQIKDEGKSIYVPEDQVEIWRLEIAKKGVNLNSTVGYEVFDKQSFGTTSFVQKINKQRALEGELMKTIKHIRGIKRARVHLSIPESSPFVKEQKTPSASVVLDLERGMTMSKEEVRGITQLVSASIERMRSKDVVVLDSRGNKLSENVGDPMAQHTASRLALESKLNQKYESQIQGILSRVVGEGKVIAKVAVKMDFTQKDETQTTYDGENKAVKSEVNNSQTFKGSRPSPQGIPGARSNIPGENPQPGIPETRNDTDKSLVTRNYNVPTKVTRSKKPSADVTNISIAVMVDGKHTPVKDAEGNTVYNENGLAKTEYQPWTEAELTNFRDIVASSLGVNLKRGDQIVIKNMEFVKEDLSEAEAILRQRENREIIKNLAKYLAIGLLISMFFFIVIRPFIQWITENTVESIEDFLPRTIEELEKIQANQKLPGLEDALPTIEDKLNPEKIEGNMIKERIISLVEGNPAKAAQILHEMIHDKTTNKEIA